MTEDDFLKAISSKDHVDAINKIYQDILVSSDYGKDLFKVTDAQKAVYYITRLECEIYNGGFDQFFFNSSGAYTRETMDALKTIGAVSSLKIFNEALSYWPNEIVPIDTEIRRSELLEKVEKIAGSAWEELDREYWKDEEKVTEKLFQFILDNSENFY